jgi:hypothetical protein
MQHAVDCFLKELDFRASDGLEVALLWRADDERLIVEVVDTKLGDAFRLEIAASEARDAFHTRMHTPPFGVTLEGCRTRRPLLTP